MNKGLNKKRVLIYTTGHHGAQEGAHLEEAINCVNNGDEVYYLSCDGTMGGCFENFKFDKLHCAYCVKMQKERCEKYLPKKNLEHHWLKEFKTVELRKQLENVDFCYRNFADLKQLRYKGVDIGMGAISTYISLTRNINPVFIEEMIAYFDALLYQQVLLIEIVDKIICAYLPDYIIFHNGRYAQFKPLLGLSQRYDIDYLSTEFFVTSSFEIQKNYFKSDIPHSVVANMKKYDEVWDEHAFESLKREKIASSFFENRRNSQYAGDKIYTTKQCLGKLPNGWDEQKENIVIFNSSEDEFCAVSKEFDDSALFNSQLEGIRIILEHYKSDTNKHFYLRIHPNLISVRYKYHADIYNLSYENFTIIPANSSISTYSLIDAADKVIVFGSTVGIEAVYWKKPVICLACAYYKLMDIVYLPRSMTELWELIDQRKLSCLYNENVLKYGFFYMLDTHDVYKSVNSNYVLIRFFGKKLYVVANQKLFGLNSLHLFFMFFLQQIWTKIGLTCRFRKIPLLEE